MKWEHTTKFIMQRYSQKSSVLLLWLLWLSDDTAGRPDNVLLLPPYSLLAFTAVFPARRSRGKSRADGHATICNDVQWSMLTILTTINININITNINVIDINNER